MNDGSPRQRSTLASYHAAKIDAETDQAEKALRIENKDATFDVPSQKTDAPSSNNVAGKPKSDDSMTEGRKLKSSGDTAVDEDFDMSMIPMTFPQRLHEILSNEDHKDAISWLPHGKGFLIHKKKAFSEQVLPLYFKESKFTSFTRKLNRWGFARVTKGNESGAYYHPFFQKGNLRRTLLMSCCQRKPTKKKAKPGIPGPHPLLLGATDANVSASLPFGSAIPAQLSGADQLVQDEATRRLQQLELVGSGLLLGQSQAQLEQVKTQLHQHQQEQIAKLEEIRRGQQENLLNQLRASSAAADISNSSAASQVEAGSRQYQNSLIELIKASSTRNSSQDEQRSQLASHHGTSLAANVPSSTSSFTNPLEGALAASLLLSRPSAATSDPRLQMAAALGASERTDPTVLLALLTAQQHAQAQVNALGQSAPTASRAEQARAQQTRFSQGQQQQLNELILQRALGATKAKDDNDTQDGKTDE